MAQISMYDLAMLIWLDEMDVIHHLPCKMTEVDSITEDHHSLSELDLLSQTPPTRSAGIC